MFLFCFRQRWVLSVLIISTSLKVLAVSIRREEKQPSEQIRQNHFINIRHKRSGEIKKNISLTTFI